MSNTNRNTRNTVSKTLTAKRSSKKKPPARKNRTIVWAVAIAVIVIAALGLLVIAPWNPPSPNTSPIPVAVDNEAKIEEFPSEGATHVPAGTKVQYQTNPPTSGNHYPTWSKWGIFKDAPPDELLVHNLEHGGVIIFYDCPTGCTDAVNSLASYANRYPPDSFTGIMLVPRTGLPNDARIALVSWQHRMLLKSLDQNKIQQFMMERFNKAPEGDPNARPMG
jgi:hypothetical protein